MPYPELMICFLPYGESFTKLEISLAFQQILLDDESKPHVVINTHLSLWSFLCSWNLSAFDGGLTQWDSWCCCLHRWYIGDWEDHCRLPWWYWMKS